MKIDENQNDRSNEPSVIRAPDLKRKLRFRKRQKIGIPLLLLIPILSLTKVLGDVEDVKKVANENVEIEIQYPKRFRYGQSEQIQINVTNRSPKELESLQLKLDPHYLSQFSNVRFNPSSKEDANQVEIESLSPGEKRHIVVGLRGEAYGMHIGALDVRSNEKSLARVELDSFVFP